MSFGLALALLVAAGLDDPVYPAAPAFDPNEAPPAPRVLEDPLARCKQMLLEDGESADNNALRLGSAERCFRQRARDAPAGVGPSEQVIARALAMADVVAAWRLASSRPTLLGTAGTTAKPLSLGTLVESGRAEGLVHGAVAGAGAGFLLAGTLFSTTRASEKDTLPWLLASPALGAVAGTAGAWVLLDNTAANPGDIAFATSTMWAGAADGVLVQLAVFDGSVEASSVPLRFITVVGGGALGLAAGAALGPLLDVTPGDAAVANSAFFWGGVMTGFGLAYVSASGAAPSISQGTLLIAAGTTVPYLAALVAHPVLQIDRWPSWLIEAGGAAGLLTASGALVVLSASGGMSSQAAIAFLGGGTLAGVGVGAASAWAVSSALAGTTTTASLVRSPDDPLPRLSLSPALFPDGSTARSAGAARAMPGVLLGGSF